MFYEGTERCGEGELLIGVYGRYCYRHCTDASNGHGLYALKDDCRYCYHSHGVTGIESAAVEAENPDSQDDVSRLLHMGTY